MLFRSCVRDINLQRHGMRRQLHRVLCDCHSQMFVMWMCASWGRELPGVPPLFIWLKGVFGRRFRSESVGYGASGRSGGQAIAGYNISQPDITRLVGSHDARLLWDLSEEAMRCTRALIREHAIACDWTDGHILAGEKPRHAREIQALFQEWKSVWGVRILNTENLIKRAKPLTAHAIPAPSMTRMGASAPSELYAWAGRCGGTRRGCFL